MLSKISLIKEVRNEVGCGLAEAKEMVDRLFADMEKSKLDPTMVLNKISRISCDLEIHPETRLHLIKYAVTDFERRTGFTL